MLAICCCFASQQDTRRHALVNGTKSKLISYVVNIHQLGFPAQDQWTLCRSWHNGFMDFQHKINGFPAQWLSSTMAFKHIGFHGTMAFMARMAFMAQWLFPEWRESPNGLKAHNAHTRQNKIQNKQTIKKINGDPKFKIQKTFHDTYIICMCSFPAFLRDKSHVVVLMSTGQRRFCNVGFATLRSFCNTT